MMLHSFIGAKNPVWLIEKDEADAIADPASKLLAVYNIGAGSEEMMLWINLFGALGIVYGPRMFAKKPKPQQPAAEVVTLRAQPANAGEMFGGMPQ